MKLKFFLLGILFTLIAFISPAQDQDNTEDEMIEIIDLVPESQKSDGVIYIVADKYYVSESTSSLYEILEITRDKVDHIDFVSASSQYGKNIIESYKKRLPEKYRNPKAIATIYLK